VIESAVAGSDIRSVNLQST